MSLWAKITGVAVTILVLAISGFGIYVLLTDPEILSTAKTVERTSPSAPKPPESTKGTWQIRCGNRQGTLNCRANQSIYHKRTGQRLLSVAIRVPPDTKQPVMLVQLPLGIWLPAGASLQIGDAPAAALTLRTCDLDGCFGTHAISAPEIAALEQGARLKVSAKNRSGRDFIFQVPIAGFAEVYAKIK